MNTLLFSERHIGIGPEAEQKMIAKIGLNILKNYRQNLAPGYPLTRNPNRASDAEARLQRTLRPGAQNQVFRSYIDRAGTAVSLRPLFSAMSSRIPAGILLNSLSGEISQGRRKLCCISRPGLRLADCAFDQFLRTKPPQLPKPLS
jgi:hypothetical protein